MTSWHLRGGYSSHAGSADVDAHLDSVVQAVRRDLAALRAQDVTVPDEYIALYASDQDLTITRLIDPASGRIEWMLSASGGGDGRAVKERSRRAFVREVMQRMHAQGLDVSVVVA